MKRPADSRTGQALLMVTLALPLLIGLLALVVDVGFAYFQKQVMQSAADSSAFAGAVEGYRLAGCSGFPDVSRVTSVAKAYGLVNSDAQTALDVRTGSGIHDGVDTLFRVTATATRTSPVFFGAMFRTGPLQASASATAGVVGSAVACRVALVE